MEILSAPTLTNIKDGFPNQCLTPIVGEPSYATIKKMERELALNTKSQRNPKSLYGYLQNMTQPSIEHALTNDNMAIPPDPGDQAIYPAGTDDLQCTSKAIREFLLPSIATIKGHMSRTRKNVWST